MSHSKLRRAVSDVGSLFVLPITAAVLPSRFGFALLKWVSRRDHAWATQIDSAWAQARTHFPALEEARFKQRQRLLMLVDRSDSYLTWLRSRHWWLRQVDVHGDWPPPGVGRVVVSHHWGAGHWIWVLLAARGLPAHVVARRAEAADFGRGRLALAYLRWRNWALTRIGSRGPIYTGGSSARVLQALADGECVMGMLDVPAGANQRCVEVDLLGHRARLRIGLAGLAESAQAPVTVFSCGLDYESGRRSLYLETLPSGLSAEQIVERYAEHVDARVRADPEAWHAWPHTHKLWCDRDQT